MPNDPTALDQDDIERRPMGVHDALECWAEGRLSVERALELTHAADVAEMLVFCHVNEVSRPLITARPECLPDSVVERLQAIADEHPDADFEVAGSGYPPESVGVLAGLEPRPQGVLAGIEPEYWWASIDGVGPAPVAVWRDAGGCEDPPQPWGAERLGVEGVLWPDRVRLVARALPPGGGIALRAQDLTDDEMAAIMASTPDGSGYSLDDIPDAPSARYPVEDGPGSGTRVELAVRVLVGTERSTVIVADPITGRALTQEVLPHGREADVAAAAVEAAIRARLPGAPSGVAGGSREPPGEPREEIG